MRFQFYNIAIHHAEYQFSVFVLHQGMLLNRVLTRKRQSGAVQAVKAETSKCYKKNVIVTYCACFCEIQLARCYFTKGSGTKLKEAIIFRLLEKSEDSEDGIDFCSPYWMKYNFFSRSVLLPEFARFDMPWNGVFLLRKAR